MEEEPSDAWWATEIPRNYRFALDNGTDVLDLRSLPEGDTRRIRSWLYHASAEGGTWEIWFGAEHPQVAEHLRAVAEDVRGMRGLNRLWIQRQEKQEQEQEEELQDALAYLRYHLAIDMYRPAENITIQIDKRT